MGSPRGRFCAAITSRFTAPLPLRRNMMGVSRACRLLVLTLVACDGKDAAVIDAAVIDAAAGPVDAGPMLTEADFVRPWTHREIVGSGRAIVSIAAGPAGFVA